MGRIAVFWTNLRASLWFVPGLMIAATVGLAIALIEFDARHDARLLLKYPRLLGLGADGSRGMLTAIASSMLTVATLAFTLTLSSVTQASAQFSPSIFRNFLRDRANQFVLGYFVSAFAFCLIVLRTIRGADEIRFVPAVAVLVGLLLALGGIVALIFFIHNMAETLQITTIIHRIVGETKKSIQSLFPQKTGEAAQADGRVQDWDAAEHSKWLAIPASNAGYLQSVDAEGLMQLAEDNNAILRVERRIGEFVASTATLISITSDRQTADLDLVVDENIVDELNALLVVDRHRNIEQDVDFGIRQLVNITTTALAPGVADTATAVTCIEFLGELIGELGRRDFPSTVRSRNDAPRLVVRALQFRDYVESAFDEIRIAGKGNFSVFVKLAEAMAFVARCTRDEMRRQVLKHQLALIAEFAEQTLATAYEKRKVVSSVEAAMKSFDVAPEAV